MILAEGAIDGLYAALAVFLYAVVTILQSAYQRWCDKDDQRKAREDASEKAEALRKATEAKADAVAQKVEESAAKINEQLNGSGLGGEMAALRKWAEDHEARDEARHKENMDAKKEILSRLERRIAAPPP